MVKYKSFWLWVDIFLLTELDKLINTPLWFE